MKKTTITIGINGKLKIEAEGYQGGECLKKIASIEKALAIQTRQLKQSFYEEEETSEISLVNKDLLGGLR